MDDQIIRVMVVDDEPPARRKLTKWLGLDSDVEIVATCANGFEAIEAIKDTNVDVLFLDVQMPQLSGFDVLGEIPESLRPIVVFATAHDQYAVDAFRLHAIDYLLKPYDHARFENALARVKTQLKYQQGTDIQSRLTSLLDAIEKPQRYMSHFTVKHQDHVKLVKVEMVDWIAAEGNYVMLHIGDTTQHLVRDNIGKLALRLDPRLFPRIHRSTIVNLNSVQGFYPASHGDYTVEMKTGTQLFMSRTYRNQLRDLLQVGL